MTMSLLKYLTFLIQLVFFINYHNVSCREVGLAPQKVEKQLFLSRRVVTEHGEFDGGVLVDEQGIIESVLTRSSVDTLLATSGTKIKTVDGGDLALMAGVVDSHVHVNEPGRTSWEGFVTATQAAAAGGITTICDMPLNSVPPTTSLKNLKIKVGQAKEEVYVDVGFWGGVIPGNEKDLFDLIEAGVVGFKAYLIDSGVPEFPYVKKEELPKVFATLNGTGTVLAFHAELQISNSTSECKGDNCPDPDLYYTYLASRPDQMEIAGVSLLTEYLLTSDWCGGSPKKHPLDFLNVRGRPFRPDSSESVHVHIVHVSAEGVVPLLEKGRALRVAAGHRGWRGGLTAETCAHYLTLSAEQVPPGHTEFKCSPPIRNNTNKQKLWEYINQQRLDLIASDHSPSTANLKGADFMSAWGGVSSVQFSLSLFWTEASARGHSLSTVSHYLSSGPAMLTGLQERKGAIRPGLDADLVFFDPNASFVVTPQVIMYKNKISPYMNRVLRGKVIETYLRGRLIYADGKLIGEPKGRLLLNSTMF